jgi:tRNA threonylcarbamoyladenosine biosynthesis protein TsaB
MRRLIIDTATRACSVALFDGDACIASFHEEIGRGHAERLVPMIAELPNKGRADAIHVNVGPGSFTGIRVGVSAARALALAWRTGCRGYNCMELVAAMARHKYQTTIDVAMTGGHGEFYFQSFDADGTAKYPSPLSLPPEIAVQRSCGEIVAGDMAEAVVAGRGGGRAINMIPNARCWPLIAAVDPLSPAPLYVRGADAKLPKGFAP